MCGHNIAIFTQLFNPPLALHLDDQFLVQLLDYLLDIFWSEFLCKLIKYLLGFLDKPIITSCVGMKPYGCPRISRYMFSNCVLGSSPVRPSVQLKSKSLSAPATVEIFPSRITCVHFYPYLLPPAEQLFLLLGRWQKGLWDGFGWVRCDYNIFSMDKSAELQQPDYQKILEKGDFFPKIFLMPSEIRLHKDQGLMVVKRNQNHPDKFEEQEVLPITIDEREIRNFDQNPDAARHPAGHGLLSLFKRTSKRRIKLAICICVYSQPKHMLKSTIKGIQESYRHFLDNAGIMPHEIIMTVIFDGIEKINNSKDQTENMISYFNEIDLKNGFRHKQYGKTLEEYLRELEQRNFNFSMLGDDKMDNVSLFTEDQLNSLKGKLFENQYNEYIRIKALLNEITALKKLKEIKVDSLPRDVHKKYEELSLNFCVENNMWYETQEEIQQYLSSKKNIKIKLIYQALHETELLCKRYIDSRLDKSILYPVRLEDDDLRNPRIDLNQSASKIIDERAKSYNYMFFCVKHKNQGKLSSHMLFFQGFCKLFDPQYCILTDVGVKPRADAIYKMWAHMEKNPRCGGVCGYMGLQLQNPSDELGYRDDGYEPDELCCLTTACDHFFTVQRAQQFQYHFAHMLDKPFEAAFGYIHVLPGAFSGYRWKALKSVTYKEEEEKYHEGSESERYTYEPSMDSEEEEGETLMKRYLKTALSEKLDISLEDSNMYLAEDRIMCLGIHALGYTLDYLPDAESVVDPVTSLTRLLGQRRRWINGSWFAFNYVQEHSYESTSCLFYLQLLYYSFVKKVSWIQITIFYVAMNLTLISAVQSYVVPAVASFFLNNQNYQLYNYKLSLFNIGNVIDSIPDIINFLYIVLISGNLLYGVLVNNNNSRFKKLYYLSSTILGVYGLIVVTLLVVNTISIGLQIYNGEGVQNFIIPLVYLRALIIFVIIGHALPILWTFSFKKYVEMITAVLSYIYYSPTYVNLLQMFAFSRIDDLSWGTKGLDNDASEGVERAWQRRKFIFVLQYLSTNVIFSYILIKLSSFDYPRNVIILSSTCLVAFLLGFRLIFAAFYLMKYYIQRPWKTFSSTYINQNRANGNRILNALNVIELKIKEIQKEKTKKKKEEEYKKLANATSQILSKTLSNFGNKLRSKVAHHMVNNNIIPKKELLDPKKKLKNRRKVNLKKNLNPVEELSNEESEESKTIGKNNPREKEKEKEKQKEKDKEEGYDIVIPETTKKNDLRARIQAIKEKRNKSAKKM